MLAGIDARAEHYPCYFFSIVKFLIKFAHQDVGAAGWSDERGVHGGVWGRAEVRARLGCRREYVKLC